MKKCLGLIVICLLSTQLQAQSHVEKVFESSTLRPVDSERIIPVDLQGYARRMEALESEKISETLGQFQKLIEWGLALRERTLAFHSKLLKADKNDGPIPAALLEEFNAGVESHLALRQEILKISYAYEDWDQKNTVLSHVTAENRLKGSMIALAGAMFLCDNFAIAVERYYDSSVYRRIINRGDSGYNIRKDLLKEVVKSYYSPENRSRMRDVIEFVDAETKLRTSAFKTDPELMFLKKLIGSSISRKVIEKGNRITEYKELAKLYSVAGIDRLLSVPSEGLNLTSKVFGNSVGLVQTRRGLLYKDTAMIGDIRSQIKPLDILLEQTPFRLTSRFIPGYFGHVAIWVGTESELKELNLWDHPLIKPHQDKIRNGECILEALRAGVELNSLAHFSDIDDIAVLRSTSSSEELKKLQLERAFRQLGKAYDFNFDVETTDTIVCSELAYIVFPEIKWPTKKVAGRSTISPDNVACMVSENGPLTAVSFYQAGKKVSTPLNKAIRNALDSRQ